MHQNGVMVLNSEHAREIQDPGICGSEEGKKDSGPVGPVNVPLRAAVAADSCVWDGGLMGYQQVSESTCSFPGNQPRPHGCLQGSCMDGMRDRIIITEGDGTFRG